MLTPAAHYWGTHTIPFNSAWASELWSTSADSPHPTSTHRAQIWENYLAQSVFSKNMSGCLIPECPSPFKTVSSSKPKLKHFILREAQGTHTILVSVKMNIFTFQAPLMHCLFIVCLALTHTGIAYWMVNPLGEGIVSCVSLNFHPLSPDARNRRQYICLLNWTI